jgi:hypothetical protein
MTLMLHAGAHGCDIHELQHCATPPPTQSHVPLPHIELVNMVKYALGYYGHDIMDEAHGLTEDGMRYFGLLSLRSSYREYTDTVGLRNSHDKTFPIGISFGSRVFVCDNLAFIGDHVIRRKHTHNSKRDLPGLVAEVVEPLADQRQLQHRVIERYKETAITDQQADHAILDMYRAGVINIQRVQQVMQQWECPEHEWGDPTAWRLFNAATYVLSGRVVDKPATTRQLHKIIDGMCEAVH